MGPDESAAPWVALAADASKGQPQPFLLIEHDMEAVFRAPPPRPQSPYLVYGRVKSRPDDPEAIRRPIEEVRKALISGLRTKPARTRRAGRSWLACSRSRRIQTSYGLSRVAARHFRLRFLRPARW